MSKSILFTLAVVATALPASGQTFSGNYLFKLGEAAKIVSDTKVQFDDVAPGSYTASCQALDASNAPLGDAVTIDIVVPDDAAGGDPGAPTDGATYPAPAGLTFQIVA